MARKRKDDTKEVKKVAKKSTKAVDKNNGISQINRFNILFIDLQVIFTILTVIMLVWYIFDDSAWHFLQIIFGITMLIIGYNNKVVYNKPKMSWVYYICGAIMIIVEITVLIWG